MMQLLINYL